MALPKKENWEFQTVRSFTTKLREKVSALEILAEIETEISEATYTEEVANLTAKHMVDKLQVDFACFYLLKEDLSLEIKAVYPARIAGLDLMNLGRGLDYGSCQEIMEQNATNFFCHSRIGLHPRDCGSIFAKVASSLCFVPVYTGSKPTGLIILGESGFQHSSSLNLENIRLAKTIADHAGSAIRRTELFSELEHSYLQTVMALANAIDAKDTYTGQHGLILAREAVAVGREMNLSPSEINDLRFGSILHDVGKIGIPDAILQKPGKLNAAEWKYMKMHPEKGEKILTAMPRLQGAAEIVRHHHEWFDGSGYPDGLAGAGISPGARILTVVDAYHAIIDERIYKSKQPPAAAVAELKKFAGIQFDPEIVEVYLRIRDCRKNGETSGKRTYSQRHR